MRSISKFLAIGATFISAIVVSIVVDSRRFSFECNQIDNYISYIGSDGNVIKYIESKSNRSLKEIQKSADGSYEYKIARTMSYGDRYFYLDGFLAIEDSAFREGADSENTVCSRDLFAEPVLSRRKISLSCVDNMTGYKHKIEWSDQRGVESFRTIYRDGLFVQYNLVSQFGIAKPCETLVDK